MPWNETRSKPVTVKAAENARQLRKAATEPEKRLWGALRARLPLDGSHFRRQVPLGPYVADFCCLGARLVVEVDGGQHGTDGAIAYGEHRTQYLGSQGYRVLRFSNRDVMTGIDVVLDTIHAALAPPTPNPSPSPQGGGGCEAFP